MTEVFQYVPHHLVRDWLAKGWVIANDMAGTHHGYYSILMKWDGEGEPE